MRFRKDNKIRYRQDFIEYRGIPAGVEFLVTKAWGVFVLRAYGFGLVDRDRDRGGYGSGALYVWSVTSKQRKRLQASVAS